MSEQLIYSAIPAIISAVGPVGKNAINQQQGYKYRSADDICDALHDSLGKHSVFMTCEIKERTCTERQTQKGGTLFYVSLSCRFSFHAKDGSHVCTESIGEAMDSGDKATNKAMTAAYKYALLQVFCLMGHEDSEVQTHEVAPQKRAIQQRVKKEKLATLEAAAKKHDLHGAKPVDDRTESTAEVVSKFSQAATKILGFTGTPYQWQVFKGKVRTGVVQLEADGDLTAEQVEKLEQMLVDRDPQFPQEEEAAVA